MILLTLKNLQLIVLNNDHNKLSHKHLSSECIKRYYSIFFYIYGKYDCSNY